MIRKFIPGDIDKVMSLWLETTIKAHNFISADFWADSYEFVCNECLCNAETYVYEDKHQIKGFISILHNNYIGALFVDNRFQGQGIGGKLLNYIKSRKPNLSLHVYVDNKSAVRFYQISGFKIIADQIDDKTGKEELLMAWSLGCKSGFQKHHQGDS